MASEGTAAVPEVVLTSGNARPMPAVGMGTAAFSVVHEDTKNGVLAAIELGYRHFDTAAMYGTEKPLGDAVAEAVRRGLVRSREEVFVTSKLWCTQCHPDLVLPSLRETLQNLQMEYVDLYLIHWSNVSLRWIYEQGVTSIVKSFKKERLKQNLEIFDWELTEEDRLKISQIPLKKIVRADALFSLDGEFTSVDPTEMDIVTARFSDGH